LRVKRSVCAGSCARGIRSRTRREGLRVQLDFACRSCSLGSPDGLRTGWRAAIAHRRKHLRSHVRLAKRLQACGREIELLS
jgi:hypothetical protein